MRLSEAESPGDDAKVKRLLMFLDPKMATVDFTEGQLQIGVDDEPQPLIVQLKATWKGKQD